MSELLHRGHNVTVILYHLVCVAKYRRVAMVVYDSIGFPITFLIALEIGVLTSITSLINITPNNFGIQAVALAYLVSLTGLDFTDGIIGAGIIRALNMSSTFILAPVFSFVLLKAKDVSMWLKG